MIELFLQIQVCFCTLKIIAVMYFTLSLKNLHRDTPTAFNDANPPKNNVHRHNLVPLFFSHQGCASLYCKTR